MSERTPTTRDGGGVSLGSPTPVPRHAGEPAASAPAPAPGRRSGLEPLMQVRTADIEPYTGLGYLSKLFRVIAIILLLLLVAEVVTGLTRQGVDAIPTLVAEVSRLIVLAGLLWGVGDLALLLIDLGHDLRATRILMGRLTAHTIHHDHVHDHTAAPATAHTPPHVEAAGASGLGAHGTTP